MVQILVGWSWQIMEDEDLVGNWKNCRFTRGEWVLLKGFGQKSDIK